MDFEINLPRMSGIEWNLRGNKILQITVPERAVRCTSTEFKESRAKGVLLTLSSEAQDILVLTNGAAAPGGYLRVLRDQRAVVAKTGDQVQLVRPRWERHPELKRCESQKSCERLVERVRESWIGAFNYRQETSTDGGLRPPQLGALHAAQGHWTVHTTAATIVMPTGTGKTETMLCILVAERCHRVLVVVPTDALRTQLASKFRELGLLRSSAVVSDGAMLPSVGMLRHKIKKREDLRRFVRRCNVVVTTMPLLSAWPGGLETLADEFSHLFVDEAHHLGAPVWSRVRDAFSGKRILQFTATPYRNDEKPIGGERIFNYPLRQAQKDGYFKPIRFKPVTEFDPRRADQAIADAAVAQLKEDWDKSHIVMARVRSVSRAEDVFRIYAAHPALGVVQMHTGITSASQRAENKKKILAREARIIVCVDMLGEGFDLPELKIAAFHDVRQSLPVTLQLAGRFTRARDDLGSATFIANLADVEVADELRKLYQRDVDWNQLLPALSDKAIEDEFDLWEFLGGFKRFPDEISLQNVRPAMSAVAYRTKCKEWRPENFVSGIVGFESLDRVYSDINPKENTLVLLTARRVALDWAKIDEIYSWDWQLYVLVWDPDLELLFINNSSNAGFFAELATAVCGDDVQLVRGPEVFRCLATVTRLRLNNVGLLEVLGRYVRFTMRAGSDVEPALSEAQKQHAVKSNVFGLGFENGARASIGCSYKGRIWARRKTNIHALKRWCQEIGSKLIDTSLDPDAVLAGTLRPERISVRPDAMPIAVEWPVLVFKDSSLFAVEISGRAFWFHEIGIDLLDPGESGPLKFLLASEGEERVVLELRLELKENGETDFRIVQLIGSGRIRWRSETWELEEFFHKHPPTLWFADGAALQGDELIRLRTKFDPYPKEKIEAWDWSGTSLRTESQGTGRDPMSIQHRVIREVEKGSATVIFDDDDSGEAADVVAISEGESIVEVEFYHCKYSHADAPGARIADLYEVCGQAQKSVRWMEDATNLFRHLLAREPRKRNGKEVTRFERGNVDDLHRIMEKSRQMRVRLDVVVVQPGLARSAATRSQLELLAVTENYLKETFMIGLRVVASP